MADRRLVVWPGMGAVQRAGGTVVVVLGDPSSREGGAASLLGICRGKHGADLLRAVAHLALSDDAATVPPFAVVSETPQGLMTLLRGDIEVIARSGDRIERIDGRDAVTWVERVLHEPIDLITIGPPGSEDRGVVPWADMRAGVVAGGGASLVPIHDPGATDPPLPPSAESAAPSPAPDPAPPSERPVPPAPIGAAPTPPGGVATGAPPDGPKPVPSDEFEAVLLVGERPVVAAREPLSVHTIGDEAPGQDDVPAAIVPGVRCSRDHHNNPAALYCSSCGIKMGVHRTLVVTDGPRPPLGVLVLDDGSTIPVQHDMVIGRDPSVDELVVAGRARPIRIEDDTVSVSRAHILIALDEWDVLLAERGSSNGTFVRANDAEEWRRVGPSERVGITTGTQIRIGERLLFFDQHHVR